MSAFSDIHIMDRVENFHLEAYYGVKTRMAQRRRKEILENLPRLRRCGFITFWDLAEHNGYVMPEDEERFLQKIMRCLKREAEKGKMLLKTK